MASPTWTIPHPGSNTHIRYSLSDKPNEDGKDDASNFAEMTSRHPKELFDILHTLIDEATTPSHPSWNHRGNVPIDEFRARKLQLLANILEKVVIDEIPPEHFERWVLDMGNEGLDRSCSVQFLSGTFRVALPKPVDAQDPKWHPAIYFPEPRQFCRVCEKPEGARLCTGCSPHFLRSSGNLHTYTRSRRPSNAIIMAPKADPNDPETITRFLCLRGSAPDELVALSPAEFNRLVMAARERLTVDHWYQFLRDNQTSLLFRPAQMQIVANHEGYPITDVVPRHFFVLRETRDVGKCITFRTAHGAVSYPPSNREFSNGLNASSGGYLTGLAMIARPGSPLLDR
ncbi:hypothetical protein BU16DRAFT_539007 [Lophium mytilinum]|uniref:Uncharacterized protein n=1 Tax=Lophium mytilinum TaxID=390894 RepID=A0A6A6QW88_9PEZI|nr:hypothetical protein BU16DRAFT_539007 [Lophium mytilinum]